ncbi:MAG: cell division protein FtsZ [Bacteroidetes bacterium]|nr:cell division protein FtsZ [Bacteroidota bacterium]MCY4233186.1 cell division protein FtsZ [Bacteroidota bacterium]
MTQKQSTDNIMENQSKPRFAFDAEYHGTAKICVVGVGGGGGNAVNSMINNGLESVDFMAINTDSQDLRKSLANHKIQAGRELTKGLGAGARPEVGIQAIMECAEEIEQSLRGFHLVFVTAGMGGGTGTGGVSIVADIARRMGILVVAIVTKPFEFENPKRMEYALSGIERLKIHVDTLIVIPNERLLDIADETTNLSDAFQRADNVLGDATRGISDLITKTGLINLDFADVKTTIKDSGTAIMGAATGDLKKDGAESITMEAISSPLMDGISISGARNVLVNLTAGAVPIKEVNAAMAVIKKEAGADTEIITGVVVDNNLEGKMRVTVIATGFEDKDKGVIRRPVKSLSEEKRFGYKGEDNLKILDKPAWERRGLASRKGEEDSHNTKIRYLNEDDAPDKSEDQTETVPNFLRKMMD